MGRPRICTRKARLELRGVWVVDNDTYIFVKEYNKGKEDYNDTISKFVLLKIPLKYSPFHITLFVLNRQDLIPHSFESNQKQLPTHQGEYTEKEKKFAHQVQQRISILPRPNHLANVFTSSKLPSPWRNASCPSHFDPQIPFSQRP